MSFYPSFGQTPNVLVHCSHTVFLQHNLRKAVFSQVGAKSRNISYLKGKVPSWIGIPTSVALPFGVFEHVLSDKSNQVLHVISCLVVYSS